MVFRLSVELKVDVVSLVRLAVLFFFLILN
jgi:hypothetical protein